MINDFLIIIFNLDNEQEEISYFKIEFFDYGSWDLNEAPILSK